MPLTTDPGDATLNNNNNDRPNVRDAKQARKNYSSDKSNSSMYRLNAATGYRVRLTDSNDVI